MYDPQKAARKRLGWLIEDTWKPYDVDEVRVLEHHALTHTYMRGEREKRERERERDR